MDSTALQRKEKAPTACSSCYAIALTVKRRFSVRGDGGGIFVAMLAELVLFRECSKCASSCGSLDVSLSRSLATFPKISCSVFWPLAKS